MRHFGVSTASLFLLKSSSDFLKLLLCSQIRAWGRGAGVSLLLVESLCLTSLCSVGPAGLYGP